MHEQEESSPPLLSISNSEDNSDEEKASYVSGTTEKPDQKPQKIPRDDDRNDMIDAMHQKLEMMFLNPHSAS
jgi:hypothetical protein